MHLFRFFCPGLDLLCNWLEAGPNPTLDLAGHSGSLELVSYLSVLVFVSDLEPWKKSQCFVIRGPSTFGEKNARQSCQEAIQASFQGTPRLGISGFRPSQISTSTLSRQQCYLQGSLYFPLRHHPHQGILTFHGPKR